MTYRVLPGSQRLLAALPLLLVACAEVAPEETSASLASVESELSSTLGGGWAWTVAGDPDYALGDAALASGAFTVEASGGDIWGTSDTGTFVYRRVSGNFELTARLDSFAGVPTSPYAKGVLFFKEGAPGDLEPAAAAPGLFQAVNYDAPDYLYQRDSFGSDISNAVSSALNTVGGGAYLRLTRTGNTFRVFHWDGAEGAWVQHGGDRSLPLGDSGFVGLAAASADFGDVSVRFSNVTLTGAGVSSDATPPVLSNLDADTAGGTALVSWTTDEPATATVTFGLPGVLDQEVSTEVLGTDHSVELPVLAPLTTYEYRVSSADPFGNTATSELRTFTTPPLDETAPQIAEVTVGATSEHTALVRIVTDEPTTVLVDYDLNHWAKQVTSDRPASEHNLIIDRMMSGDVHEFTVTVTDRSGNATMDALRTLETRAYASEPLPDGWASLDIGLVSTELPGSAAYDPELEDGTFHVRGTGTDVFFDADSFHFVHYPVRGDFVFTLRVDGYYGYLHQWTKAMTMFRADLSFDAQMFNQSINYSGLDYLYYRNPAGVFHTLITSSQLHPGVGEPVWARLTRRGDTFTEEYSWDGDSWWIHGPEAGTTVDLPETGYVGFGVCGKSNAFLSEIIYSQVTVENCGDGRVVGAEQCDDGNLDSGDECEPDCTFFSVCGDGTLEGREVCDDGNTSSGDGCDAACQPEPFCGDGNVDPDEECDDNNATDLDGCTDCTIDPACGDAALDPGEECDDGNLSPLDGCTNCTIDPACGDGTIDDGENCDDGNNTDDDGCSASCRTEDRDSDSVLDRLDNCPDDANLLQLDLDEDGAGDACDDDLDGDGLLNQLEDWNLNGALDSTETDPRNPDTDADGLCDGYSASLISWGGHPCEDGEDYDGDGVVAPNESDPLRPDTDGDCVRDDVEVLSFPPSDP
jgi:cysteine-rich repeat protein